ncbi:MAG: hypothetical protein M0R46_02980 [Candidatus Muirbacterium halophilum]|nr:hypothetical protein [Candidatus Muirbacterium halophilum]MCK9474855.1 hypothetical protein [Candidatus Muirbacterium halophilum]
MNITGDSGNYVADYKYNAERLEQETENGEALKYAYTRSGKLESIKNNNDEQKYIYNRDGNISEIIRGSKRILFAYDKAKRVKQIKYPGEVIKNMEYYSNGMVKEEKIEKSGETIYTCSYVYNNNNHLIERKEFVREGKESGVEVTEYKYDSAGKLVKAYYSDGEIEEFKYDDNGNRIELKSRAYGKIRFSYDKSRLVKITTLDDLGNPSGKTEIVYDEEGNIVMRFGKENAEYEYDDFGRLSKAKTEKGISEYNYSPLGRRLTGRYRTEEKELEERYIYAGANLFEVKTEEKLEKIISGNKVDEIYGKIESDGNEEYYIRDYLGNIKAIFDKDGIMTDYRRYRAFGEEMIEPENGFGFTSREYDEISGLYYYRSRYYDAKTGRFLQKDKYNEAGILSNNPSVVYNPSQWIFYKQKQKKKSTR